MGASRTLSPFLSMTYSVFAGPIFFAPCLQIASVAWWCKNSCNVQAALFFLPSFSLATLASARMSTSSEMVGTCCTSCMFALFSVVDLIPATGKSPLLLVLDPACLLQDETLHELFDICCQQHVQHQSQIWIDVTANVPYRQFHQQY